MNFNWILPGKLAQGSAPMPEDDVSGFGTIVLCAIDNLAKGASGGAVQAANVALGLDETAGLASVGLYP